MSAIRHLVLFDIDGTLLHSSGAGRAAMERALEQSFGTSGDRAYRYDGKTDKQIVRESMQRAGIDDATVSARMDDVVTAYLSNLGDSLRDGAFDVVTYPGVNALLDAVETAPDMMLGLLTGNVEPGAHLKLRAAGVDPSRFRVNAFGSDHDVRGELPAIAHSRMRTLHGLTLEGRDVVVIGDTPADIACGRGIGARAIAVATGHYTVDELRAHEPFAVFPDLSDTDAVMRAIRG